MEAAATLRAVRQRSGLTQSELARLTGTSQAAISAYENGAKAPSLATLQRLLAVMNAELTVQPAAGAAHEPSRSQLARSGRILVEVLALAEALPARRARRLGFPRLAVRAG